MVKLLGINCEKEIEIDFAFKGSATVSGKNPDGWGYTYLKNDKWMIFKEPFNENQFELKNFQLNFPANFISNNLISHIRFASKGNKIKENTHPFELELFDKKWTFAHSGHLTIYKHVLRFSEGIEPKGDTDSEEVFCTIMTNIKDLGHLVKDKEIALNIEKTAKELAKEGGMNFILSDGDYLFAYYSGFKSLYYAELRPPFDKNVVGEDHQLWFTLFTKDLDTQISIVASEPIIPDISWKELEVNELLTLRSGKRTKFLI
ncbi:MAG: Gamma-glutamyl-hercynylcysteine sulfoxide hydrolase [Candidatus Heimdallarchaeota archaeon AB_125]|nr:MAG: Gamma-glutamyl-hercynylcysteine sulfoxide hydrolase [Candidatus Heimdallarchaeota archaeon AB_125]